jgi:hypothetical protein
MSSTIEWNFDPVTGDLPDDIDVIIFPVEGEQITAETTEGAFLNFSATNVYKSSQIIKMAKMINRGMVHNGDKILVTDAWNPGVIQLRYMLELLGVDAEIHAIWHAGSYDPWDFLGRLIKDKRWSYNFEESLVHACHKNYFATDFHIDLLMSTLAPDISDEELGNKIIRSGQPHNELIQTLEPYATMEKEDLILFPHRIAPEKQPEIFRDLAQAMPEYKWVVCQEEGLTKDEYHDLLSRAKIVFSANLQETLGISAMEAVLVNTCPLVPARLSYKEMYDPNFLYPSDWTADWERYQKLKPNLVNRIKKIMDEYDRSPEQMQAKLLVQRQKLVDDYLRPNAMFEELFK